MTTLQGELIPGIANTPDTPENTPSATTTSPEDTQELFLNMEPLTRIADGKSVRIPKNPHFTRKDVVQAFQASFELIGGVPRLALWANNHETEFFKLYSRLLPSQASSALGETNELRIQMHIAPGPLDE